MDRTELIKAVSLLEKQLTDWVNILSTNEKDKDLVEEANFLKTKLFHVKGCAKWLNDQNLLIDFFKWTSKTLIFIGNLENKKLNIN